MSEISRLTVVQHNVQHWATRKNELYNTYRHLDPDVILINSHGVKEADTLKMYTYTVYKKNYSNQLADGVAIAVKNGLNHKLVEGFENLLAVEIETNLGPVVLATIYLPPRRPALPMPEILRFSRLRKPAYLMGDLNARHLALGYDNNPNATGNNIARLLLDGVLTHLGPDFPTYISGEHATTPDIVLGNRFADLSVVMEPGPLSTSDHIPIVATISTNPIITETVIERDDYSRADWEGLQTYLQNLPRPTNLRLASIEEIEEELNKWFTDVCNAKDQFVPKVRHKKLPCPRPTREIELLQTMFSNVKNLALARGWTQELKTRYMQLRHELRVKWSEASQRTWERLMANTQAMYSEPDKFWKEIRRLTGRKHEPETYLINNQNEKIWSIQGREALHRQFWEGNFRISDEENRSFNPEHERRVENELSNHANLTQPSTRADFSRLEWDNPLTRRITPREIKETIKSFANGKAPGFSGISKTILEKLPNKMISRLCDIFNACLSAGYFPKRFKMALLHLIPKEGNPHLVKNRRPISLLECPGKIFEKIINTRLTTYLTDHDLYNRRQHGFRKGRGTHTALSVLYETAAIAAADKKQVNLVMRDVSKAFDKVWHKGLKLKLIRLGLPECFTKLLCNFLDGRTARIRLEQFLGEVIHLESGVPQGSCLSPTLYAIFTADIPPPRGDWDYVAYADDITQVIMTRAPRNCSTRRLALMTQRAIDHISDYEKDWKIATNRSKFKVINLFNQQPVELVVDGTNKAYDLYGTALGLKFGKRGIGKHVTERAAAAEAQLCKLKRFGQLSEGVKTHLYKALIRPMLEYPTVPHDTLARSKVLELQQVQNSAIKWIANWTPPYTTTMVAEHERLNLETLNVRIHRLSRKTWQKVEMYDPESYERLSNAEPANENHNWLRRSLPLVEMPEEIHTQDT